MTTLRGRYRAFPYTPSPHMHSLPRDPLLSAWLTRVVHFPPRMNLHPHIIITQSPQFILAFTLHIVHSMFLDKRIMTFVQTHHYNVIRSIFTALKIPSTSPLHSLLPLSPLATTDLFIVSITLPFLI